MIASCLSKSPQQGFVFPVNRLSESGETSNTPGFGNATGTCVISLPDIAGDDIYALTLEQK
jgi:hypothetical protein